MTIYLIKEKDRDRSNTSITCAVKSKKQVRKIVADLNSKAYCFWCGSEEIDRDALCEHHSYGGNHEAAYEYWYEPVNLIGN